MIDLKDLKRRMEGAVTSLKSDFCLIAHRTRIGKPIGYCHG